MRLAARTSIASQSHSEHAMADLVGDDKIVGVQEHPERVGAGSKAFDGSEEAALDEVDIARIEKVYRYVHNNEVRNTY